MPFTVFDYRRDIRNLIITPEIRSRFLRMEPGEVHGRHSHDLGHEVFLILEGQCEMEIDGERAVLGPGQMCFAYAHEMHQARNAGDGPMVMYLSVTPHVQPTHTLYDEDGQRRPPRYGHFPLDDRAVDPAGISTEDLAERQVEAAWALATTAQTAAQEQSACAQALKGALAASDSAAVKAAVDGMWEQVYATYERLGALSRIWNHLAPRTMPPEE